MLGQQTEYFVEATEERESMISQSQYSGRLEVGVGVLWQSLFSPKINQSTRYKMLQRIN
jgi:hypothetical protein